jgi:hypothetical protein
MDGGHMLKKKVILLFVLGAFLFTMSCSTMSSISRTLGYNMEALFNASMTTVAQLNGKVVFANRNPDASIIRFTMYEGIATALPDEVTVNLTKVSDTLVNMIVDVHNSSPQLIDWKSKETTLSRFEKGLYDNLGSNTK